MVETGLATGVNEVKLSRSKKQHKVESGSFRHFAEKVGMFLRPAKLSQFAIAESERINLDSVVIIDMSAEQPLVEAFRHVKLMSHRGQVTANVLVTKVHSEVQAHSVFNKLTSLCESFLNVNLQYLGGVPSDAVLKSFSPDDKKQVTPANDGFKSGHPKAQTHLDFIQEYWIQTHPLMSVSREKVKNA